MLQTPKSVRNLPCVAVPGLPAPSRRDDGTTISVPAALSGVERSMRSEALAASLRFTPDSRSVYSRTPADEEFFSSCRSVYYE